jgi:hypothetical protein
MGEGDSRTLLEGLPSCCRAVRTESGLALSTVAVWVEPPSVFTDRPTDGSSVKISVTVMISVIVITGHGHSQTLREGLPRAWRASCVWCLDFVEELLEW